MYDVKVYYIFQIEFRFKTNGKILCKNIIGYVINSFLTFFFFWL